MQLEQVLSPERTLFNALADSKKRVLSLISELATQEMEDEDAYDILTRFVARERLGSTAIGRGVALPHARLPGLDKTIGVLVHCKHGVEFDSPDEKNVDLFFGLLVPEEATEEHLQLLATLAKIFRQNDVIAALRDAKDSHALYNLLIQANETALRS